MAGAPAFPAAQAGWGAGLRYVVIMLFALLASTGHATIMASQSGGPAMAQATDMTAMACCDDAAGAAHATPACGAYFAPTVYQIPQPLVRPAQHFPARTAPVRNGRTLAPPLAPPRYS
ncbi:MAG TPA: hypothetical protein VIN05_13350 [Roseovarius sp.]